MTGAALALNTQAAFVFITTAICMTVAVVHVVNRKR